MYPSPKKDRVNSKGGMDVVIPVVVANVVAVAVVGGVMVMRRDRAAQVSHLTDSAPAPSASPAYISAVQHTGTRQANSHVQEFLPVTSSRPSRPNSRPDNHSNSRPISRPNSRSNS